MNYSSKSQVLFASTTCNSTYLKFLPWPSVIILTSFDDLLLVSPNTVPYVYCICNPLSRQWIVLPQPPIYFRFTARGLV